MGHLVIACYRPKPGKTPDLLSCIHDHMPVLAHAGLITDRPSLVMKAKDGSIAEIFEWKSEDAVEAAHSNSEVLKLWERFSKCCEYITPADITECHQPFSPFEPVEV